MARLSSSVSETLARIGAHQLRAGTAGRGLSLAEWTNDDNRACYDHPGHHTLSIYVAGGERNVREDGEISGGAPDKLCLLPAGHESYWRIGGPVHMFHLYIEPEALNYQALATFDMDPRRIEVMDLTFADDPALAMIARGAVLPLDWQAENERMALSSACHLLLHRVLKAHVSRPGRGAVKGGLAPALKRRLAEYIEAHLEDGLTLDDLAHQAGLSTYHLAKMFRSSFGLPPHRYVNERRIERARSLLRGEAMSLAQIALACGFASQSHFTNAFKAATGLTPRAWRDRV